MLIASFAAVGVPGFAGFYSKTLIVTAMQTTPKVAASWLYYLMLFNFCLTAFYTFRMFFLLFHQTTNNLLATTHTKTKLSLFIQGPLIGLAIFAVVIGWCGLTLLRGGFYPQTSLTTSAWSMFFHGFLELPFGLVILGGGFAWLIYVKKPNLSGVLKKNSQPLALILQQQYWFNSINTLLVRFCQWFGQNCLLLGDKLLLERLLINNTVKGINVTAKIFRRLQTGYLSHYLLIMLIGLLSLLILFFLEISGSYGIFN
jgi:NADH-quinone oxidoreductase subunit L